ncbi:corA-like mg2+ transporter protein [Sarocladium implicatum]|nr:corA-like mg2+ transporter protein [Sarocladium implicatum]
MEGLAALAKARFETVQNFAEPGPSRFEACEAATFQSTASAKSDAVFQCDYIPAAELIDWHSSKDLRRPVSGFFQDIQASIKIFVVNRDVSVSLHITEGAFREILARMQASPQALYFISRDYDGCHYWNEKGCRPTWFVGTSIYGLLWTFDKETCHTAGIFIHRRRQSFQHFGSILQTFAAHAHLPQLLLFVIPVQQIQWYDDQTVKSELSLIRTIEQQTGFGPHPQGDVVSKWARAKLGHDIDKLTTWSQHIAELSGNFSNKMRHQKVAGKMLRMVVGSSWGEEYAELVPDEEVRRKRYEASLRELSNAVPQIERHMEVYADYLRYLKERSDRLSNVLFALLTHEDAEASIELATATRRDGSSMKTIAIMTMAFLPGTFFAAFFSMPMRKDDAFWIYWVCAIPATAMVFVLWLGFSERKLFESLQMRFDRVKVVMGARTESAREMFSGRGGDERVRMGDGGGLGVESSKVA